MEFKLIALFMRTYDSSFGGYAYKITARIEVDAKAWTKLRDKGHLGMLYGVDVGNALYRTYEFDTCNPTVDHSQRASKGIKTIELYYYTNNHTLAEKYGMQGLLLLKSGEVVPPFSGYADLLKGGAK